MNSHFVSGKRLQLFLLPFAGGSCFSFDFLKKQIGEPIEFIALELPGRGKRIREALLKSKAETLADYVRQVKARRNGQPYVIYGHSMGATLGLSVTNALEKLGDPPLQLIVSGSPGPGLRDEDEKRYLLSDEDFKEEIRSLGGAPEEVLENEELFEFFSPILRADFEVFESDDAFEEGILLQLPVCALMGSEESKHTEIENWKRFTTKKLTTHVLSGSHFFINDHPEKLAEVIVSAFPRITTQY